MPVTEAWKVSAQLHFPEVISKTKCWLVEHDVQVVWLEQREHPLMKLEQGLHVNPSRINPGLQTH